MADLLTQLTQAALYKRAALIEQWLANHMLHYPGPRVETPYSSMMEHNARCSCGESLETTLLPSLTYRIVRKI